MRRILAGAVAVVLVAGAFVLRNRWDEEERRGPYRLLCATELRDVCDNLAGADVTTISGEPAGATADRLIALPSGGDPGFDGWLSAGRWGEIVDEGRRNRGLDRVLASRSALGQARVGVVIWKDRAGVARQACGGTLTWRCLGDIAGRGTWAANRGQAAWGPVKVGLSPPIAESQGLAGLASATAAFTGASTFVPGDLSQNDEYRRWLRGIAVASYAGATNLAGMLSSGPALSDMYIGFESEITRIVASSARRGEVEVVYLSPAVVVDAVLIPSRTGRATPEGLADAVRKDGWMRQIPGTVPLPAASVLAGLRQLWQEAV